MDKQANKAFTRALMEQYYPDRERELREQEQPNFWGSNQNKKVALAGGAAQDATENKPVKSIAQPARVGKGTRITQTRLF